MQQSQEIWPEKESFQFFYDVVVVVSEGRSQSEGRICELHMSWLNTISGEFFNDVMFKQQGDGDIVYEKFDSFKHLMKLIDQELYKGITQHQKSFIFCTYGKDLFLRRIPAESTLEQFHPQQYTLQFLDIRHELFQYMMAHQPHLYPQLQSDYNRLLPLINPKQYQGTPAHQLHQSVKDVLLLLRRSHHLFGNPVIMSPEHIYGSKLYLRDPWFDFIPQVPQEIRYYAKIRGIPFAYREPELLDFFASVCTQVSKEDIALIYEQTGQFSGDAIIRLKNIKDHDAIKQLNMKHMEARYIEVYDSAHSEFQAALETQNFSSVTISLQYQQQQEDERNSSEDRQNQKTSCGVVKLRGLPWRCGAGEVAQFFGGLKVDERDVRILYEDGGRASGEAFVTFDSLEKAEQAKQQYNKKMLGHRYIEIFVSNSKELNNFNQQGRFKRSSRRIRSRSGEKHEQQQQQQQQQYYYMVIIKQIINSLQQNQYLYKNPG